MDLSKLEFEVLSVYKPQHPLSIADKVSRINMFLFSITGNKKYFLKKIMSDNVGGLIDFNVIARNFSEEDLIHLLSNGYHIHTIKRRHDGLVVSIGDVVRYSKCKLPLLNRDYNKYHEPYTIHNFGFAHNTDQKDVNVLGYSKIGKTGNAVMLRFIDKC